tara:strand:- start:325 stop:750 length:426 start_codon:yes stop_codon:yes gene_type:complete
LKKIFLIFFCLALTIIFFHNIFLHKIIQYNLQKKIEKKINIENININFKNQKLTINNIKIFNDQKFEYESIFFCSEITLDFNFFNLFQKIIYFDEIIFKDPIIYIEIKENETTLEDNISVLEKKKITTNLKFTKKKKMIEI